MRANDPFILLPPSICCSPRVNLHTLGTWHLFMIWVVFSYLASFGPLPFLLHSPRSSCHLDLWSKYIPIDLNGESCPSLSDTVWTTGICLSVLQETQQKVPLLFPASCSLVGYSRKISSLPFWGQQDSLTEIITIRLNSIPFGGMPLWESVADHSHYGTNTLYSFGVIVGLFS